jgi:hypothetical protein
MAGGVNRNDPPSKWVVIIVIVACIAALYLFCKG